MTSPYPDVQTRAQLALIRLLHLQGVEQADRPEPLSLFSLLTFHDSVELFLVLAADHLHAPMPKGDPGFMDYWHILRPTEVFPAGVNLVGKGRMDRLNRNRNALKHAGALPSRSAVDDALRSTASFFEDNTEAVFGIAFDAIDMADVVPQEGVRALVKAAATAEAGGDRTEAMADLAEAFETLVYPYIGATSTAYQFGRPVRKSGVHAGMGSALQAVSSQLRGHHTRGISRIGQTVDKNIAQLTEAVSALQKGMRVMAIGIDYARYNRFQQLVPTIYGSGDQRSVVTFGNYAPNQAEYDYCVQFVISVALRVAEMAGDTEQPSWVRARLAHQSEALAEPTD